MVSAPVSPSSSPGSEKLNCIICLSPFTQKDYLIQSLEVVEILSDIFKILSTYMQWAPPSKFQYNFSTDFFPFCKDCRLVVVKLCKFDSLLLDIHKQIDILTLQLSVKILGSELNRGNLQHTKAFITSESSSGQYSEDLLNGPQKSRYYRNSVCRRYFPSVSLISDPTIVLTERDIEVDQDEPYHSDGVTDDVSTNEDGGNEEDIVRDIEVDQDNSCPSVSNECQTRHNYQNNDQDTEDEDTVKKSDNRKHEETPTVGLDTEPFPSLGDRVRKVGDCQYLLDSKCHFECSKTRFYCVTCNIQFGGKLTLEDHLINDCPGYPADDVIKSYKYYRHVYDQIQSGELRCRRCKYLCSSKNIMFLHLRTFHASKQTIEDKVKLLCVEVEPNKYVCNQKYPFEVKDDKFNCGTCLSEFSTRSEVLSHIQREHIWIDFRKKVVFETISPDKFVWTDAFNKKFSFERLDSMYKCDQCLYSTSSLERMKEHVRYVHIDPDKLICKTCGKVYKSIHQMRNHRKMHADDRQLPMCEFCGKSYISLPSLAAHKALQHPEICDKKYECEPCGRVFGTIGLLTAHGKTHTNSVCHVCGKNFLLSNLNNHMLSHGEENTFKCKTCGKNFRHPNSLSVHLRSHDGANCKPYECNICGMKFTQHYSVTRHKNVVHNSNKTAKTYAKSRKRRRQEDVSIDEEEFEESFEEEQSEDETYSTRSSTHGVDDTLEK